MGMFTEEKTFTTTGVKVLINETTELHKAMENNT